MVCTKCFAEIPDNSVFCLECGSRLRDDTLDPLYAEGSDREVYPELARANLLRIQGRYEEAIEVCRRILGRYPSNETVHALLGDIYADQGKLEDAIQWYELLVELAPQNLHYSAKLHHLRAMHAAQTAPAPPAPEVKPARHRLFAYGLYGLLGLIVVGAAFVAGARMQTLLEAETQPAKTVQASAAPAPKVAEAPRIPPPAPALPTPSPSPPPTTTPEFTGMSAVEAELANKLSQRLNGVPVWCAYDPSAERWYARLRIQSGVLSKERVLQEVLALARAFYTVYPNATSLSVTVVAPSPSGGDVLVFSSEIAPNLAAVDPATLKEEQMHTLLQQLQAWWNPTLSLQG
ncbi:MAG: tetratricopeptide repeat protein [Armatimonadota bacterium]|nr:tetratricopeptide repeat protein [Armatimonadota bacterium]